jgi:S-adenosylhomocysteine hydrolase
LKEAAIRAGIRISPDLKLITVQHLVWTNVALFEALFDLGLLPRNVFVIGKGYSTSPHCLNALQSLGVNAIPDLTPPEPGRYQEAREKELLAFWRDAGGRDSLRSGKKLLVADVGGRLLSLAQKECAGRAPARRVAGVELTTSGIRRLEEVSFGFPVVNVAESAAKEIHESPLVARAILQRLDERRPSRWPCMRTGVIGLGAIGRAMVKELTARGLDVVQTDAGTPAERSAVARTVSLAGMIHDAEIVFGCTGCDLFASGFPRIHHPDLLLVSCSSEDVEFRSLLHTVRRPQPPRWPASDVTIDSPAGRATVLSGGYPLNFDASGVSVAEQDIEVTTTLMLAGLLAGASIVEEREAEEPTFFQIPTQTQSAILRKWRCCQGDAPVLSRTTQEIPGFEFLRKHSGGRPLSGDRGLAEIAQRMLGEECACLNGQADNLQILGGPR